MKLRAEAMLKIDEIMAALPQEDRELVAADVFNTWAHGVLTRPGHVGKTRGKHVENGWGNLQGGGTSSSKKRDPKKDQESLEILAFLNLKAGKSYRPVEENLRFIRARLNTATLEDIKGVIARKTREWLNTEYAKYLRPATLFNATRFEQYLGERPPQ